ncbi:MULE domain-containing protein [Trichonephila clavipes]|nr:MULE domain-containing protein [Trichonephila clavipes]
MDCTQKQEKRHPSVSSEGFFDFKLNQNVEEVIVCDAPCDSVMNVNESFLCHRSGNFVSDSKGLRHLKILGSNKINAYCPAALKVIQHTNGKCVVSYQKIHIGHQNDIGHLFLTADERKIIASKIAAKIPLDNILDEIRNSISDAGLERVHLLTKKHLHNIEKSFHLSSHSVKHENDVVCELHFSDDAIRRYTEGGNILGMAYNREQAATSAYVFMIQSLLSPLKEVVHIMPVKKIDGEKLFAVVKKTIVELDGIGFKVIGVVSDDNSINRKAMSNFSVPPKLSIVYPHPSDSSNPLFFVIDSVHIFKCILVTSQISGQALYLGGAALMQRTQPGIVKINSSRGTRLFDFAKILILPFLTPPSRFGHNSVNTIDFALIVYFY